MGVWAHPQPFCCVRSSVLKYQRSCELPLVTMARCSYISQHSGGSAFDWMNTDDEQPQFLQVRSMVNLIGRGLHKPEMRYYNQNNPRQTIPQRPSLGGRPQALMRITNAFGEAARPNNGKNTGKICDGMFHLSTVSATTKKY